MKQKSTVLVLGDSHASVFLTDYVSNTFPDKIFDVIAVGGATISGLPNPNSVTQAMPQFQRALEQTTATTVVVMLGEVDTGFVIWYRAQKYDTAIHKMFQITIERYQDFLMTISRKFRVICISTPLPTIRDGTDWGEIANARKEVTASQVERTRLTCAFNEEMNAFCLKNNISYLMLDQDSIDEHGLLKSSLRNTDPSDHHYDALAYGKLLCSGLYPMLQ